ncbi:MAG: hypothetical protein LIP02_08110 [Bacteroidales bacterium]|nr:hypothetical protein [Bacteroidales bacterium]
MKCKWLKALMAFGAIMLVSPLASATYYLTGGPFTDETNWPKTTDYPLTELLDPSGNSTGIYYSTRVSIPSGNWWALSDGSNNFIAGSSTSSDTSVQYSGYCYAAVTNNSKSYAQAFDAENVMVVYDSNLGLMKLVYTDGYSTFYVSGTFNDWGTDISMSLVGDDWYTFNTDSFYNGSAGLKIAAQSSWSNEWGSNGSVISNGVAYMMADKQGGATPSNAYYVSSSSYTSSSDAIKVKFYFHHATGTLIMTKADDPVFTATEYYFLNDATTWDTSKLKDEYLFTEQPDGTYIYKFGSTTWAQNGGDWQGQWFGIAIDGTRYVPDDSNKVTDATSTGDGGWTTINAPTDDTNKWYSWWFGSTFAYENAVAVINPTTGMVRVEEWGTTTNASSLITKVYLYSVADDTTPYATFTASSDGTTFTYSGPVNNVVKDKTTIDAQRYYLVAEAADGTLIEYSVALDPTVAQYWIGTDHAFVLAEREGGNFCFCHETESYFDIKVALTGDQMGLSTLTFTTSPEDSPSTFMPLTAADFADGKAHYFYVGTRTANWRLLPEWEFKSQSDGTYKLSGRLMYPGLFGIAKVDSYADYCKHIYTLYTNIGTDGGAWVTEAEDTHTLKLSNSASASKMEAAEDGASATDYTISNAMMWRWNRRATDDTSFNEFTENPDNAISTAVTNELMMNVAPAYLNSIVLDLSGDTPVITIDASTDRSVVADYLTFTLTGSDIKYEGRYNDSYSVTNKAYWQRMGDTGGWQDSWIQWSGDGQPYIDGNGETLYNTAFDANWLRNHPIFFHEHSRDFYYSSRNLTFYNRDVLDLSADAYKDIYYMHPQVDETGYDIIGNGQTVTNGNFSYIENFIHYTDGTVQEYFEDSNWECYVMKDVWINGDFKIWTGWGGNRQADESISDSEWLGSDNSGTIPVDARWFYENGGHGNYGVSKPVLGGDPTEDSCLNVYGTARDVNQANFMIYTKDASGNEVYATEPMFYKRIILWYDPDKGFSNSVVQLITEAFGPQIQAFRKSGTKNQLEYKWRISVTNTSEAESKLIDHITFNRYTYNDETGGYELDIEDVGPTNYGNGMYASDFVDYTTIPDENLVPQGTYYYEVIVTYVSGTDEETGETTTVEKSAESNTVTIAYGGVPVTAKVDQVLDSEGLYTFDIKITAVPTTSALSMPVYKTVTSGETTTKVLVTVADVVDCYFVVPADTYTTKMCQEKASDLFTELTDDVTVGYATVTKITTGTPCCKRAASSTSSTKSMLPITIPNVAANKGVSETGRSAYKFNVYMMASDADTESWEARYFSVATAQGDVVMPTPAITPSNISIKKTTTGMTSFGDVELMPVGTCDGVTDTEGNLQATEAPIMYTLMNDLSLPVTMDLPKLSNKVTEAGWTIDYTLKLMKGTTVISSQVVNNSNTVVDLSGVMSHVPAALDLTAKTTIGNHSYYGLPGGYTLSLNASAKYFDEIVNTSSTTATGASGSNLAAAQQEDWITPTQSAHVNYNNAQLPDSEGNLWWVRHGNIQYKAFATSGDRSEDCTVLANVPNGDLNLYLGYYIPTSFSTPVNGTWWDTRASNGGVMVPQGGYYGEDSGLNGYTIMGDSYDDSKNNWARIAATEALAGGFIPVQIMPMVQPSAEINTSSQMTIPEAQFVWYIPCYQYSDMSFDFVPSVAASEDDVVTAAISTRSDDDEVGDDDVTPTRTLTAIPLGVLASAPEFNITGTQTGVESISADADGQGAYFTLQGQRVTHPVKGQMYLRVTARGAEKVLY